MHKCPKCGYVEFKKERSNFQNRYYWGVAIDLLSEHTGSTPEEVHSILKTRFLKSFKLIDTKLGMVEIEYVRSTSNLTTKEFEEYLSQVRIWASSELSVWIPEPNESTDV